MQPMVKICCGDIFTENVRASSVVATSPALGVESEATVADIASISDLLRHFTSSRSGDVAAEHFPTGGCYIKPYNRTDLTQGGSAVGQVVLGYRNLGHRGLAQPKNSIHP